MRPAAATVLVLAATAAGCGGQDDPKMGPARTVRAYLVAFQSADGKTLCGLYSKDYRKLVEDGSGGRGCAKAETDRAAFQRDPTLKFSGDERHGDKLTATIACQDSSATDCSLPLVIEDGEWRVDGSLSPND